MSTEAVQTILFYVALYNFFICGGFGMYAAAQRNRGGIEGFLLGWLLGPPGVIAAACLPTVPIKIAAAPAAAPLPPFLADAAETVPPVRAAASRAIRTPVK